MYALLFFIISVGIVLAVSRKNIGLSLFLGSVFLGIIVPSISLLFGSRVSYSLSIYEGGREMLKVFNPKTTHGQSTILLALAVAIIPLIGGTMKTSGQMEELVNNLRLPKQATISFLPAILGMLPMPGGALLSSPLVEKAGKDIDAGDKAAINVWFRHILFLIYPIAPALLISSRIAGLNVYRVIPYLFPFFLLSILLGYFFLLQGVTGSIKHQKAFSFTGLLVPLLIIFIAPLLDLSLKVMFPRFSKPPFSELALVTGVVVSLSLAVTVGKLGGKEMWKLFKETKPWNFALIIFGMFAFLNVCNSSSLPRVISDLHIPPQILFVIVSFFLGLGTGRIQAPMAILIPIIISSYPMTPLVFAIVYFSVFIGYVLSPVHPCVSVSVKDLNTSLGKFFRSLSIPSGISFASVLILSFFLPF